MSRPVDYSGQTFHGVTILERIAGPRWHCRCHCGREFTAYIHNIRSGATKSCGCAPKGRPRHLPPGVYSVGTKHTPCYLAMGTGVSILGEFRTAQQAIAARAAWEATHPQPPRPTPSDPAPVRTRATRPAQPVYASAAALELAGAAARHQAYEADRLARVAKLQEGRTGPATSLPAAERHDAESHD